MSFSFSPPCHVRVKSVPLLPMTSEPPSLVMSFSPWNSSGGGSLPPSYHVIFTGGTAAARRELQVDDAPERRGFLRLGGAQSPGEHSRTATRVGVPSSRPQYAVSRLWMPMSPIAPVPKSQNPRHLNGTYAGLYGRSGAGPSHTSQSSVGGTGGVSVGRSTPCGHQPAGRSVQTCSSVTSPITPARMHLDRAPRAFERVALRAHLRRHARRGRRLRHLPHFPDAARERLLAVHVLAELHRGDRHDGVVVIGRGDEHRVDVLLGIEHAAPVAILPRVGVLRERLGRVLLVAVAERDDLRARRSGVPDVVGAAPARADDGERHPIGRRSAVRRAWPRASQHVGAPDAAPASAAAVVRNERREIRDAGAGQDVVAC